MQPDASFHLATGAIINRSCSLILIEMQARRPLYINRFRTRLYYVLEFDHTLPPSSGYLL
jgi:hypothetical protein